MPRFIDANIFLRYFTWDNEAMARAAYALLTRVERREEAVTTAQFVVAEVVFTLDRFYEFPRADIRDAVGAIIALPGVLLEGKVLCLDALDLFADHPRKISFADAYSAAYMRARGITETYSWDHDFDSIDFVTRVEPELLIDPPSDPCRS